VDIDSTNHVSMTNKPAFGAFPIAVFRFMAVTTFETSTTRTPFVTISGFDACDLALIGEVVDIGSVFPSSHALVVFTTRIFPSNAIWIPNVDLGNTLSFEKAHNTGSGFMAQISNSLFSSQTEFVFDSLQFFPARRTFLAARLFFGNLTQLFVTLPLE
jgi:hypothetical protein